MSRWPPFVLTRDHVRFEADGVLVVSKPAGLAVHATVDPKRPHLLGAVQAYVHARGGRHVSLHHRLDVDTSGLVLLCTDPQLDASLSRAFAARTIDKHYRALVCPDAKDVVPRDTVVENFLGRDTAYKHARYRAVRAGGKKAITEFYVRGRFGNHWSMTAKPVTGRAHQIRVHCAQQGWPIVGDRYYAGVPAPRLMLHAERLGFEHPCTRERVVVEDPPRWPDRI